MLNSKLFRWHVIAGLATVAGLLAWPAAAVAQTVEGQASAVRVTKAGLLGESTTLLAGTGALGGTTDAQDATLVTGSVPAILTGETLRAVTIGWRDQVASEASLGGLSLIVGTVGIAADFVMSRATSAPGTAGSGSTIIENLSIGGVPVLVTGAPNQTIAIPAGWVVINEQTVSGAATTVNALHAVVPGLLDVVIASSTAGIR